MQYELFLRRDDLLDEQQQRHIRERVEQESVTAELFGREDGTVGVDLGIDTDVAGAAEPLCKVAFELAAELGFSVYDPQLGAVVLPDDRQQIIDRVEQTAAFLEGVGLGASGAAPISVTRGKLWIYVAAAAMALLLLGRLLTCSL